MAKDASTKPVDPHIGFLENISHEFEDYAAELMQRLLDAQDKLEATPSDPAVLAKYQAALQDYTLFRNAQTNVVKAYKDIASAIVQNYR